MRLLLRTNDLVVLSKARAVLEGRGIGAVVLDEHMSVLDGSIGALPRRLMVADEDAAAARRALREAGLGHELDSED
ncbi:MAG: hypothetical protein KatS3mg119_1280 [Rhodothalassiaceae bacterium]|nr:MAG: hypothetical protein KatS3mg119_1280 [Rhodothalassiaceae bacterium]